MFGQVGEDVGEVVVVGGGVVLVGADEEVDQLVDDKGGGEADVGLGFYELCKETGEGVVVAEVGEEHGEFVGVGLGWVLVVGAHC